MKKDIEIKNLDSKVIESYSYFINNLRNTNFDALKSISLLLVFDGLEILLGSIL